MDRLNLKPWELKRLSVGEMLDYLACLAGEARANRVQGKTQDEGDFGGFDAGQGIPL